MITPRPGTHSLDTLTPEVEALLSLIPNASYLDGVEVGTLRGRTATLLLSRRPGLDLEVVDIWDCADIVEYELPTAVEEAARLNLGAFGDRVGICDMTSLEAAEFLGEDGKRFDFVYLDAKHDRASVEADIAAWWPKVRPGGMLCGHDYDRAKPEAIPGLQWDVKGAVDAFAAGEGLEIVLAGATVWAVLKPAGP